MRRYVRVGLIVVILVAAVVTLVLCVRYLRASNDTVATVTLDGEVIATYNLSRITTTETFTVGEKGAQNTIRVSPAGIAVIRADCPDQVCVHQGVHSHGPTPIVCLPHKLSITFSDPDDGSTLDAVAGQ